MPQGFVSGRAAAATRRVDSDPHPSHFPVEWPRDWNVGARVPRALIIENFENGPRVLALEKFADGKLLCGELRASDAGPSTVRHSQRLTLSTTRHHRTQQHRVACFAQA